MTLVVGYRRAVFLGSGGPSGFQQLFYFSMETAFFGLAILYFLHIVGCLTPNKQRFVLLVVVPLSFAIDLSTGTIGLALRIALIPLFLYCTIRRRIPWPFLGLGLAAILLLQPAKTLFRAQEERESRSGAGIAERVGDFVLAVNEVLSGSSELKTSPVQMAADRMNIITTFAECLRMTPTAIPFWKGETYRPLLWKLIPRVIYPAKPLDDVSQSFPHRYGLLSASDLSTSYKLPQLVEAYINFGTPGVVVIMFIVGTIYQLPSLLFVHEGMGAGAIIAGVYMATQMLDIEANFSLVFGGLQWVLIFLLLTSLMIRLVERLSVGWNEELLDGD